MYRFVKQGAGKAFVEALDAESLWCAHFEGILINVADMAYFTLGADIAEGRQVCVEQAAADLIRTREQALSFFSRDGWLVQQGKGLCLRLAVGS